MVERAPRSASARRDAASRGRTPLRATLLTITIATASALATPQNTRAALRLQQLPNALTLGRLAALPPLALAIARLPPPTEPATLGAMSLFAAIATTDALDGTLARLLNATSEFGKTLDPVADKMLVCTTLVLLSSKLGLAVALPAALIVSRELAVSGLREWMAARGAQGSVAVAGLGKLKTATQMSSLLLLLANRPRSYASTRAGLWLLRLAAALTLVSGAQLVWRALAALGSVTAEPSDAPPGPSYWDPRDAPDVGYGT